MTYLSQRRVAAGGVIIALLLAGCAQNSQTQNLASTDEASSSGVVADDMSGGQSGDQALVREFDLQAHRGGRGETTEESARAFSKAIELGVTTLELDIVTTKDGVPVVWHDNDLKAEKCEDTEATVAGDPQFPYVGKYVHDLTWDQVATLECGKLLKDHPNAEVVEGNKLLQLKDVFDIVDSYGADDIRFNIETKVEADKPETSASPQESVDSIMNVVTDSPHKKNVMIQSFDWRTLEIVRELDPSIPLVLLWGVSDQEGDPGYWYQGSPWIADVDYGSVNGDIIAAAKHVGATVLSPQFCVPYPDKPTDLCDSLLADKEFVDRAHGEGMKVVTWTVDEKYAMKAQIEAGVDGIITDYPTMLREVMGEMGMELPKAYTKK